MASDIKSGRYRIFSAGNPDVSIGVYNAAVNRGANIAVFKSVGSTTGASFSDVWDITYRADGTARIVNVYSGKLFDLWNGEAKNATNIQQWDENNSDAQKWTIEPTGKQTTRGTKVYKNYKICLAKDHRYIVDTFGQKASPGSNIMLYEYLGELDQEWNFVSVPLYESNGLYEIRSFAAPNMCLDVKTWSKENGARVHLFDVAGTNNQKWYLEQVDGKWKIRSINSGKYLDLFHGNEYVKDGQQVGQWENNNQSNQRWKLTEFGTYAIGGKECAVVSIGSYATSDGNTWLLDSSTGLTTLRTWVVVHAKDGTAVQLWVLVPTTATDKTMPIPQKMGVSARPTGAVRSDIEVGKSAYLTWECADAWATVGANHYEWRYRKRYMNATRSTWGAWSSWSEWRTANCNVRGNTAWLADDLPLEDRWFDWTQGKQEEFEYQVRTYGTGDTAAITGAPGDCVVKIWRRPKVNFTKAAFSGDGLHLEYISDYAYGTNHINVRHIKVARTGKNILRGGTYFATGDINTSFVIPLERINFKELQDGDQLTVYFDNGTEAFNRSDTIVQTLPVALNSASHVDFHINYKTNDKKNQLEVDFPALDTRKCYFAYGDKIYSVEEPYKVDGGRAYYSIPFPYEDFVVYCSAMSSDMDTWGVGTLDSSQVRYKPAHAWSWGTNDGLAIALNVADGIITDRSITNEHEKYRLSGRKRNVVRFDTVSNSEYTASGIIRGEDMLADLIALQEQKFALYRPPYGGMVRVAITDVSYTTNARYTEVKVSMVEVESLWLSTGETRHGATGYAFIWSRLTTLSGFLESWTG